MAQAVVVFLPAAIWIPAANLLANGGVQVPKAPRSRPTGLPPTVMTAQDVCATIFTSATIQDMNQTGSTPA